MNHPHMTQREIESRAAYRLAQAGQSHKFRRVLRLDNPNMFGERNGDLADVKAGYLYAPGERR